MPYEMWCFLEQATCKTFDAGDFPHSNINFSLIVLLLLQESEKSDDYLLFLLLYKEHTYQVQSIGRFLKDILKSTSKKVRIPNQSSQDLNH